MALEVCGSSAGLARELVAEDETSGGGELLIGDGEGLVELALRFP